VNGLLGEVDQLYLGVVCDPQAWNEQRFADWAESATGSRAIDRIVARYMRRILSVARKLQAFWANQVARPELDWRSRVDLALGPRAWRPVLDLAKHLLDAEPSEELFDRTGRLFRLVNNEPYLDGIGYEAWAEDRANMT